MDETLFWSDEQKRLATGRKEVLGSEEAKFNALLANAGELIAVDPIIADAVPSVHDVADPKLKPELTKIKSMVAEIEAMQTIIETKVAEVEAKLAALGANEMDPITADAMPVKQIMAYAPEVKKHNAASSGGRHRDRGY
jgi:hypothetical protein